MTKTIMIVDDEPDTIELINFILENEGYKTSIAYSGFEALEKIKTEKPDMVLLDIMMPEMDGWTVRKKLLEDKETKDIPIVILTARSQPVDKMIGLHMMDVAGYITKPFRHSELVDKIRSVLGE